jgi:hypothetical protein
MMIKTPYQREQENDLYKPTNIKLAWLAEKLRDAEAAVAEAAKKLHDAEVAEKERNIEAMRLKNEQHLIEAVKKIQREDDRAAHARILEQRRHTYYHKILCPEMKRLNAIFHADIDRAMAPTTGPKEKALLFLKHDGVIREYNELVYHMVTFPYNLKNYMPEYEKKIGDELDRITLDRLATLEKPKRRKRLSVAAKVRYAKEWRKLNLGYSRHTAYWNMYSRHYRPTYLKDVTINNVTPAKLRLLRRVYSKAA